MPAIKIEPPDPRKVMIGYVNHRGELTDRAITPLHIWWGTTKWHPQAQWLLHAYCHEKQAYRDFAMTSISEWSAETTTANPKAGR